MNKNLVGKVLECTGGRYVVAEGNVAAEAQAGAEWNCDATLRSRFPVKAVYVAQRVLELTAAKKGDSHETI